MTELGYLGFSEGMMLGTMGCIPPRTSTSKGLDLEKAYELCQGAEGDVKAGLAEDWVETSGVIWRNGMPAKSYLYAGSSWATPIISFEFEHSDCYVRDGSCPTAHTWIEFCKSKGHTEYILIDWLGDEPDKTVPIETNEVE